ncbi:MAG: hypothetical protein JRH18_11580 [Deltaproteobacteria bacterium]|nr:hypothetical protein [Deltaproteobacteria bacterium]
MKTIVPGHHLIRLALISNTNIGTMSGQATLDRPTQVDAYYGLPFLPNSVIRGVMRNAYEASSDEKIKNMVDHFFGTRNRITNTGDENFAGQLVIGNGDLLTFPVRALTGERCWVFPRLNFLKFLYLESISNTNQPDLSPIISRLTQYEQGSAYVLAIPGLPPFSAPFTIKQIQAEVGETVEKLLSLFSRLSGNPFSCTETVIFADERASGYFWQQAAEILDTTAVDNETKYAKARSLRRIETIPEGSVFCSFFTLLGNKDFKFPMNILQLGSFEGNGLGYCKLDIISSVPASTEEEQSHLQISQHQHKAMSKPYILMRNAYETIVKANKEEQAFRDKLASAIGDFGWRLHKEGLQATIAFALAKAKPTIKDVNKRKPEARAYERLISYLLNISGDLSTFKGQPWFSQAFEKTFVVEVLSRWQWLRRYSELELQTTQNLRYKASASAKTR